MTAPAPPRLARWWLERCLPDDPAGRSILGDLIQEHAHLARSASPGRAAWWFRWQSLRVGLRYLLVRRPPSPARDLGRDLRLAVRTLARRPGTSLVVIATLALGVGPTAAVYSVVDAVLLRPLPYPDAERLVRVWSSHPESGDHFLDASYRDFTFFRQEARSLTQVAAVSLAPRTLRDDVGDPSRITLARVSEGFFRTLGTPPNPGRDFLPDEEGRSGGAVILSHAFWQGRYGGDREVVGRTVLVQGESHTVVGVAPPGMAYPREADLWRPFTRDETEDDDRELAVLARLAPGVSGEAASREVEALAARLEETEPEDHEGISAWVQPLRGMLVREVRTPLVALLGAVGFLLLIACVNVAHVLLARGADRRREMAVRVSLGADGSRLFRQLLTESLILAAVGGGAGLLLGYGGLELLVAASPPDIPRLAEVALDGRVVAVMALVVGGAGVLSGLAPAFRAAGTDPQPALRGTSATGRESRDGRLQGALVMLEVALSTVLVAGAGFLGVTFVRLVSFDRGLEPEGVLSVSVNPSLRGEERREVPAFFRELERRVAALPGVRSVALATHPPSSLRGFRLPLELPDRPPGAGAPTTEAHLRVVTPGYFSTLAVPLLAGHLPERSPGHGEAGRGVTVNRAFVRENLGGDPAAAPGTPVEIPILERTVEVTGVVEDVTFDATEPAPPMLFSSDPSLIFAGMVLLVRADDPAVLAGPLRERIWALDPTVALDDLQLLDRAVAQGVARPRFHLLLMGTFAGLALVLATVGIYGVTGHAVARRTREIGVRKALGAPGPAVARGVVGRVLLLTAGGTVLGVGGALGVHRLISSVLYGVHPAEPVVYASLAVILGGVALAASVVPALRAARVEPITALRAE